MPNRTWLLSILDRLSRRPYLRAVLSNTSWLMADRILRMLLGVLVGAWVARYLGPGQYGQLAYISAFIALFQAASNMGADGIIVRDIAQSPQLAARLLGTILYMRLLAGLVAWVLACVLFSLANLGDMNSLAMVALLGAGLVFQASDVVDLWFQSQTQSRRTVLAKSFAYCSAAVIKVILILSHAPLWTFAAALLADIMLASLAMSWAYRRLPVGIAWAWDKSLAVRLLRESWPFLLSGLAIVGYMRIDQIMLRELAGDHALGLYSAVLPFSQAWNMVPMTVCVGLLPRLSSLRIGDPVQYRLRLQQLFTLMVWTSLLVTVFITICANWLVEHLLGSAYIEAVSVLRVHVVTNVFVFLGTAQSIALIADRTPHIALLQTLSGVIASVLLNLLLIPRYGALGAAWVAVLSYGCSAMLSNLVVAPEIFMMQVKAFWPFNVRHT